MFPIRFSIQSPTPKCSPDIQRAAAIKNEVGVKELDDLVKPMQGDDGHKTDKDLAEMRRVRKAKLVMVIVFNILK